MTSSGESTQDLVEAFVLAAHGDAGRVQDLHARHPELLTLKWEKFDENALEAAGHMGRRDIAGYILDNGAPLTIYAAAMLGMEARVATFLDEDPARARTPGVHGFTLMYHAALSGKIELAELLLRHGGDEGMDAALHGAVAWDHPEMATWLLAHGANVNGLNFEGKTALRVAVENYRNDLSDLLRAHGGTE